ncbi:erythromycin esterase family protein [Aequorivita xiaoshiensis]|uniref:Erythromycin esterase family protein n=1 Tax=Aequorivita xiaoshiensis TaxID=2874476 RepID=A0A9X1R2Y0_9FLAO|nr:erythromycin esterase family protein [Aequorivita xiaoshiensis]MCG2431314.1 erythromycin esterase family protein [Aequorivita xiaoshiensis]
MKLRLTLLMVFSIMTISAQNFTKKAIKLDNASSLDPLIAAAWDKKLVLLGEASHGTHEYYIWRDKISRRLIEEHNFNFIAVEGDFASLYKLNQYVKNFEGAGKSAREVLMQLNRWPTWMWANEEVVALAEWLRQYNDSLPPNKKVGFYGMDVYDEWVSKEMVLETLKKIDESSYNYVKLQYNCFNPYKGDSWQYARAVKDGKPDCEAATERVVTYIRNNREILENLSDDEYFYLLQNAIVVHNAEEFYRESIAAKDAVSWNSRVFHMRETVGDLLALYGKNAKGVVWAHNTHIGDASFTSMRNTGEINIGQLKRENLGKDNVFLIGFSSYKGKVIAGSRWGARMEEMTIPRALRSSVEYKLKKTGLDAFYLIFDEEDRKEENLKVMGHRAIGVVYNPQFDRRQFVPTIIPLRYDALIFFNETTALQPLHK